MKLTDLERQSRDTAWPALSSDLRTRVLAEATVVAPSITWSDRVWFSRTWRLGFTAAAFVLLAINQFSRSEEVCCAVDATLTRAEADAFVAASIKSGVPADVRRVDCAPRHGRPGARHRRTRGGDGRGLMALVSRGEIDDRDDRAVGNAVGCAHRDHAGAAPA